MYPIIFQLGPLTIYSFGAFMALAALTAVWLVNVELKRGGHNPELASTMVFAAAIGGLIGTRFLFIVEEWQEFLATPMSYIFTVAGFTWYGGFFGVGAGLRRWPDRLSLRRRRRLGRGDNGSVGRRLYQGDRRLRRSQHRRSVSSRCARSSDTDL